MSASAAKWITQSAPSIKARPGSGRRDIRLLQMHAAGDMIEVGAAAGRIVIDDGDIVAVGQQQIDQVAADEPRAAGDDGFHPWAPAPGPPSRRSSRYSP